MKDFLDIYKIKLKLSLVFALTFSTLIGLIPTILLPDLKVYERLLLLISIIIGFTIVQLMLTIVAEYYNFSRRRAIYNKSDISDFFVQNRFNTVLTNIESMWKQTSEVKKTTVKGYTVIADMHPTDSSLLRLNFLVKKVQLSDDRFNALKKLFIKYNAEFDFDCVGLNISHKKTNMTVELSDKLLQFADLLSKEGFVPNDTSNDKFYSYSS